MSGVTLGGGRTAPLTERTTGLLPGLGLLFAVGYAGKLTEQALAAWGTSHHVVLPNIEAAFLWAKSPKFVLGVLAISLLVTFGAFSKAGSANSVALSRWGLSLTFAGVGLSTHFRKLQALGWRPSAVAAGGMAGISVLTFAFVWTADWSGWL